MTTCLKMCVALQSRGRLCRGAVLVFSPQLQCSQLEHQGLDQPHKRDHAYPCTLAQPARTASAWWRVSKFWSLGACLSSGPVLALSRLTARLIAPAKPWARQVTGRLHCSAQRRRCLCAGSWPHLPSMTSSLHGSACSQVFRAVLRLQHQLNLALGTPSSPCLSRSGLLSVESHLAMSRQDLPSMTAIVVVIACSAQAGRIRGGSTSVCQWRQTLGSRHGQSWTSGQRSRQWPPGMASQAPSSSSAAADAAQPPSAAH